jgi:hypothetical protein
MERTVTGLAKRSEADANITLASSQEQEQLLRAGVEVLEEKVAKPPDLARR